MKSLEAGTGGTRRVRRDRLVRRGVVCILAMLFLVFFSVLAVGFFFSTTMSAQISANERSCHESQLAAESGMRFLRYQLSRLSIKPQVSPDKLLEEVNTQLGVLLEGTDNLGTRSIGYDGKKISIPAGPNDLITLSPLGQTFRATITSSGDRLTVKVVGSSNASLSKMCRAVETEFKRTNLPSSVFDFGLASRGKVQVKASSATSVVGTPDADGSILSVFPGSGAISTGSGPIEGDLTVTGSKNDVALGGGTVGGTADAAAIKARHTHVIDEPLFPYVDTTVFRPLATNLYVPGAVTQKNIRVPANANPRFNDGDVINGILYIESPNNVTFRGNAVINGLIVFENKGSAAANTLDFRGNVSPSSIPAAAEFDAVRAVAKGWAIAAPLASVTMSGSVDGTLEGSVIASSIDLNGSADLHFKSGSIITLGSSPTMIEGKAVEFAGTAADNPPVSGVRFLATFLPDLSSYREVAP